MTKIILQFHATRAELASLIGGWASKENLWLAYEVFSPAYRNGTITKSSADDSIEIPPTAHRVVLSIRPIDLESSPPFGLVKNNPDALMILIGNQTHDSLGESALQATTNDSKSLAVWRQLRRSLISSLHKGADAVDPVTGETMPVHDYYYSAGAQALARRGVKMLAIAGAAEYRFSNALDEVKRRT